MIGARGSLQIHKMILSNKFVSAGFVLLCSTIILVGVQSRTVDRTKDNFLKRHIQDDDTRVLMKRDAADTRDRDGKIKKGNSTTTEAPSKKNSTTQAPTSKDRKKKKMKTTTSTTKKPSTGKPTSKSKEEKKKETNGVNKIKDKSTKDETESPAELKLRSMETSKNVETRNDDKLRAANERWLQNQEIVAIEHMLAGVYDWIKVLTQTRGRSYNKLNAGELFNKINNDLIPKLRDDDKPDKMIEYFHRFKQPVIL